MIYLYEWAGAVMSLRRSVDGTKALERIIEAK